MEKKAPRPADNKTGQPLTVLPGVDSFKRCIRSLSFHHRPLGWSGITARLNLKQR